MMIDEPVVAEFDLSGIPDLELFLLGRVAAKVEMGIQPYCQTAASAIHDCIVDAIISEQVRRLECPGTTPRRIFLRLGQLGGMSNMDLKTFLGVLQQGADDAHAAGYRSVTFWSTLALCVATALHARGEQIQVGVDRAEWVAAQLSELESIGDMPSERDIEEFERMMGKAGLERPDDGDDKN